MFTAINKLFTSDISPKRTVFYRGETSVSFDEFSHDVARMANVFSKASADTVILFVPNDIYLFYVCFMGLMQAGKDVVLPAMLTDKNIGTLRELSDTIVTDQKFKFNDFKFIDIHKNYGDSWNFCDMDTRRLYFFTSGSTGAPKKICKTIHNLAAEVAQHNKMQGALFDMSPVLVASIAPYHMYGILWRFFIPLASGVAIDTELVFTPEELQSAQDKFDKILFVTTPSFLDGITKYQKQYLFKDNCVGIFTSGSLLDNKTSTKTFETFGVSPFEVFGSTETGGIAFRQQKNGPLWNVFDAVNVGLDENNCIIADSDFCCSRPFQTSDVVEMQGARNFLLKGRADRIVKIAEERISLPEYEEKLNSYKFIEQSYVTTVSQNDRTVIGCVITLNESGKEFIISHNRHAFVIELKTWLSSYFPTVALPRKIRIVNSIPTNTQGKILKSQIIEILRSNIAEPIIQKPHKATDTFSGDLTFLHDSAYFKGHFENHPILPGVIQLYFVIKFINLFFNRNISAYDVIKLKFTNLILPDTLVHFELNKLSDNEFYFSYENGDVKYSSGKIVIKE